MTTETRKRIVKFLIRIIITALLLGLVLSRIDRKSLQDAAQSIKWEYVFILWMLTVIVFWVMALRMRLILAIQKCDVTTFDVFRASTITNLYSLIMPGFLSTGVKWYILKRQTGKGSKVLSSMVYNQAADITIRVFIGLFALLVANPFRNRAIPAVAAALAILLALAWGILIGKRTSAKAGIIARFVASPFPVKVRQAVDRFLGQLKAFQGTGLHFYLTIIALTAIATILGIATWVYGAKAVGIDVPVTVLVWVSSAVFILGRIPISIANFGVREISLVESLALYGVEAPTALLLSFLIFSRMLLLATIGAAFQITWAIGSRKSKSMSVD